MVGIEASSRGAQAFISPCAVAVFGSATSPMKPIRMGLLLRRARRATRLAVAFDSMLYDIIQISTGLRTVEVRKCRSARIP